MPRRPNFSNIIDDHHSSQPTTKKMRTAKPSKKSATQAVAKTPILTLPEELRGQICQQVLLDLYDNEGQYADEDWSLSDHYKFKICFDAQADILSFIPGFVASNTSAKRTIHGPPSLFIRTVHGYRDSKFLHFNSRPKTPICTLRINNVDIPPEQSLTFDLAPKGSHFQIMIELDRGYEPEFPPTLQALSNLGGLGGFFSSLKCIIIYRHKLEVGVKEGKKSTIDDLKHMLYEGEDGGGNEKLCQRVDFELRNEGEVRKVGFRRENVDGREQGYCGRRDTCNRNCATKEWVVEYDDGVENDDHEDWDGGEKCNEETS